MPTGNSTNSTALSNITQSGSTYKLVDMNQFVDAFGARDFSPDVEVSKNVYVRFSSANVFEASDNVSSKPHGNVNISLFEEGDDDENWQSNYFGLRRFRYFQVKTEFDINDYGDSANATGIIVLAGDRPFTVVEVKEHFAIGRKLTIELLEFFDSINVTQRNGNARVISNAKVIKQRFGD